jgi:hypothetical protein
MARQETSLGDTELEIKIRATDTRSSEEPDRDKAPANEEVENRRVG